MAGVSVHKVAGLFMARIYIKCNASIVFGTKHFGGMPSGVGQRLCF